ncbi:MAG: peroxide stress protein YaaA [Salibacteraceae bacterium]
MIVVLSPAKTLNFENPSKSVEFTDPPLLEESEKIMNALKKKSVKKLIELQGISQNLGEINFERNQVWSTSNNPGNSKQAISAFKGDVYVGLNEEDFTESDYNYAQKHLRILSGLYGILKPLDRIQPYRLEMGTPFKNSRGKNLYEFWKMRITDVINVDFEKEESPVLVNLASDEYFKGLKSKSIKARIVQPVFMDMKNGKYKVISFFAKKARGMMTRFIIKNKLNDVEQVKAFDSEGYLFNKEMSTETKWYFTRNNE